MTINYSERLNKMRERRTLPMIMKAASFGSRELAQDRRMVESYQRRDSREKFQYALGAMEPIDHDYTRICLEEADRVTNHLSCLPVTFELQGSVPLNIHIRTSSDIDVLTLHTEFLTYSSGGQLAGKYGEYRGEEPVDRLARLRIDCERILVSKFPAAKVDTSGAKAISLSGGSLQRKVDIVPAHWHDSLAYQISRAKHDREVRVLDKINGVPLPNSPFLHIKKINDKDVVTNGGAKKVIRLLKTLRRDCGKNTKLSSYDIASLVWHLQDTSLNKPADQELALLGEALWAMNYWVANPLAARELKTPDNSRKILDSTVKQDDLAIIRDELQTLSIDIAKEGATVLGFTPLALYQRLASLRAPA